VSYIPQPQLTPQSQFAGDLTAFGASNNQIVASQYDPAGNQIRDAQNRTFDYDGENRQTALNTSAAEYGYDGDGRRVTKIINGNPSKTTVFVYDAVGQLVAEYTSDPVPPPAGLGGTSYLTTDHLGSTRIVTKSDGNVKARYDYLPFGEELGSGIGGRTLGLCYGTSDSTNQKFTQKERDNETGLDYFGARYYSSAQGRFTGPDPIGGSEPLPQSWNLYAYVQGHPINFYDPDGKSTHTDKNGYVVAVYDDGDLGVYKHGSLKGWNGKSILSKKGKGINRMGETEYWDEFRAVDDNTGQVLNSVAKGARILFKKSWDKDLASLNQEANKQSLQLTAADSKGGQRFDIKTDKNNLSPNGPYTGKLLNGKYASARSAGNYLFGMNAATGNLLRKFGIGVGHIDAETAQKLAGAFQQGRFSKIDIARIMFNGAAFGPAPYYGEIPYSGRMQIEGFAAGQRIKEKK